MGRTARPWFREFDGYWYGVVVKGTPARKLLKASNTKANERKALDIFNRLTAATDPHATTDASACAVLVEMFLTHAQQACKPNTYRTYSDNLNYFTGYCGKVPCRELTFHHADDFLKKQANKKKRKVTSTITVNEKERKLVVTVRPWGPNKQATFIKSLKACFNWGVKTGKISHHPFAQLKASFKRSKRTVVPEVTLLKLFAEADGALKDLLTALRETGCRPSEIARVTADDVHGPTWVLEEHKNEETGQPRVVWLNATMQELTKRLVEGNPVGPIFRNSRGRPWTKDAIVTRFRKLRARLKLPKGVIAYATGRHSYITTALTNGVPTAVVAHLTGTSEKVIKRHYAHLDSEAAFMLSSAEQATRRSS
jgi:integrase